MDFLIMKVSSEVRKVLQNAKKVLIIISRPIDYDCIASGIVLRNKLIKEGKKVELVSPIELPEFVRVFPLIELLKVADTTSMDFMPFDLIIALDGANTRQFADVSKDEDFGFGKDSEVLNIDHHLGNNHFAKYEIWDPKCSSTTEVLLSTLIDVDKVSKDEATLLYAGLAGDTGNFRYMLNYKVLDLASKLLRKGADYVLIVNEYFHKHKQKAFEVYAYLIGKTIYNHKLAYSYVVADIEKLIQRFNCDEVELKGGLRLYSQYFGGAVEDIHVCFLIKKYKDRLDIMMTGNNYLNKIPLPEVGKALGGEGGGHFNFAGYDLKGEVEEIIVNIEKVVKKLREKYKQR